VFYFNDTLIYHAMISFLHIILELLIQYEIFAVGHIALTVCWCNLIQYLSTYK